MRWLSVSPLLAPKATDPGMSALAPAEADVGPKGLVAQGQLRSERAQHRFNLAEKERGLAVALRELAEARLELARRVIEAFARAPSPSAMMH